MYLRLILSLAFLLSLGQYSHAQIYEIRAGANIHDIEILGLGENKEKENSIALNAEIIFEEPEVLKWALSPQPYFGGTLNIEGKTSYGGAGLMWRQTLSDKFYGDFAFGLVAHDGTLEFDRPTTPAENVIFEALTAENIEFGSRILFRHQFTLGYRFSEDWSAEFYIEHLSHGKILSSRSNEGLDVIGWRAAKRF